MRHLLLSLSVCFLLAVTTVGTGSASTWVVKPDSTGDAPTIQAAIDSAGAGDTVMVICGTYHEHNIEIKSGIYLTSATGTAYCATIDADSLGRVFYCRLVDSTTSIVGFTITNGLMRSRGGGMHCSLSHPRVTNCTFLNNHADSSGGGLYISNSSPVFTGCVFSHNVVTDTSSWKGNEGGGVWAHGGSPAFNDCVFSDNEAPYGGGAGLYANYDCWLTLENCVFERNTSYGGCGAFLDALDWSCVPLITNCTFRDNVGIEWGGGSGLHIRNGCDAVIKECTFEGNLAEGGGALATYRCSPTITDCEFRDNTVTLGGGAITSSGGSAVFSGCSFLDNSGRTYGGAACLSFGDSVTFDHCLFAGNSVSLSEPYYGGGAIGVSGLSGASFTRISNCTFYGNSAPDTCGILFCSFGSSALLDNSIVAFSPSGGVVSLYADAPEPPLTCCDIYGNVGGDWVGPIADQYGMCGNISDDPLFVDPGAGDFHLLPASPCNDPGGCGIMGAYGWREGFGIRSIVDVPDDKGGLVSVEWERVSFDSAGSDTVIDSYTVWRRVDTPLRTGGLYPGGRRPAGLLVDPPGTWEQVDSVAAIGQTPYTATCATACDSTEGGMCWSVFFVKAHCSDPVLEFATWPDSGYSTDNTAHEGWTDVTTDALEDYYGPGSGLAWVDYDSDGDLDLYVTNRTTTENRLYRNDSLTAAGFVEAAPPILADPSNSRGCPWGDYDNDGDLDLYISNKGGNKLLRNDGNGSFVDVTTPPLDDGSTGQTAAWADYDNDGDLDLYVVNNGPNRLFRNDSAAVFTDVTAGPLGDASWGMGMAWGDYDGDGDMDIYVANYDGANILLENQGSGVFTDATTPVIECPVPSYGAAWGDYDNDGDLDLYVTNEGANRLFRNYGDHFENRSEYPTYDDGLGRSAVWGDYNLDGYLDLYLVNCDAPNGLFKNKGDCKFMMAPCTSCPFADAHDGFSAAWGDYDKDGDLDLYIVNDIHGSNRLLRNDLAPGHHWLEVDPIGVISNADGVGARVCIVVGGMSQLREITGASGFASQGPLTAWFGLGTETVVDVVEVTWPASGIVRTMNDVACDQSIEIYEVDEAGLVDKPEIPVVFRLYPNRPNPFSALTAIRYDLPETAHVELVVYDVSGRAVRRLLDNQIRQPGCHVAYWDGRNAKGKPVAAGVYFCRLRSGTYTGIERMLLLR